MGRIYRRNGTLWGYYTDSRGNQFRRSLRTTDPKVARKRLRDFELAGPADRAADQTLGGALKHLLDTVYAGRNASTVASYRQKARHLVRVWPADMLIADIDRSLCQEYRAIRLREGAKAHSIHKEGVVLRLALQEQGIEGVVPKFKAEYKPKDQHLSLAEFRAVMRKLNEKRRLWFMVATFLGIRDKEVNGLRWEDVDLDRGVVRVRGTKTKGSDRVVPISAALVPWLKAEKKAKGPVVEKWTNRRRDITAAWWTVKGYKPPAQWRQGGTDKNGKKRSIAGAPRLSPNDLRRTFTSWLKQSGADSMAVARLLGHKSTKMIEQVYGRLRLEDYERVVALLPEGDTRDDKE